MRASRLLSILLLLQTRGRMTAETLAEMFEVSVRTIYRDIEELSAANVPVFADRGPGGGFELLDGFRTKLTGLTESEAETLFVAGLPGPASQMGLADQLLSAQLKLTAALPERNRASAHKIAQRFHLDPVDWFRSPRTARLLPQIAKAVWSDSVIEIDYRRGDRTGTRRLKPLGLVLKAGVWYLVASASDRIRTYRISNIVEMTTLAERFARPKEFDLARFWTESSRAYEIGLYRDTARLRVSARGLARLEQFGRLVADKARETAQPEDANGWREVEIPIESLEQAEIDLLRIGPELEILKPKELRRRFATAARAMAKLNR
ncbi:Predicted DNA-binding transcriptional regulator YafY, contains an HTH and WYL domains [Enhydrobacter aerosaccus]|uniref:Predicted DNA-binding transcriptional regulator YafY, contains an HTH and WYL domains n=1 Tax=Enhydrobacter aerosaccus TaxID=225324 RepID=A0A1T4KQP1_9HYPH|nr:WYL domain-containing protein [Enhydrobacter aerosaccus]SJZ44722.1 Predicted DNA-binding transcriptional regulator YafY, contains an HTH and WYL domains [Enhydrobacter aerosaccus]